MPSDIGAAALAPGEGRGEDSPPRGPTVVRSVYVHAPFCARRCLYCDFAVHVQKNGDVGAWAAALAGEVEVVAGEGLFALADRLDTLYVGGGTPSLLGPEAMRRLAEVLGPTRLANPEIEWTAEANPESFTADVASGWRRAGVNRLSLGVQSFDADALRWMGRLHGSDGPLRAVRAAREAGIDELSVDLIFGLPATVGRSWSRDLEGVLALGVPHVSLYGLTVESGTALGRAVAEGRETPADEERYRAEYLEAVAALTGAGYVHYEVSNFALPGHESRHNSAYWDGRPYLGLGNGAHSFAHPVRRWNTREWQEYHARSVARTSPESERETLTRSAVALEAIWLGLRTDRGVSLEGAPEPVSVLTDRWIDDDLATRTASGIRLTPAGWLLLDRLAVDLDGVWAG